MEKLLPVAAVALVALVALARSDAAPGWASRGAQDSSFAIYLVRGERVSPVRRVRAHGPAPARVALAALLRGLTAVERRQGYSSAIPAGTTLRGVSLAGRVLTVDLNHGFESGGGSVSMLLRVAQVVHTATQFAGVERVAFRLDGRPVAAIGGEGVIVSPPVGRKAFEAQVPPILVEQPLPGDRVSAPLVVRGTANVFEAQFLIDVQTASGRLLARRTVHASGGSGSRGTFAVRIALTTRTRNLVVVAYDRSAKDGSRTDLVRVPVTLTQTQDAAVIKLDEHANGEVVHAHVGDRMVVTLKANASTGYAWRLLSAGAPVLRLDSTHYAPASQTTLGSPGRYTARFTVRTAGRAKVALAYMRHTQPPTSPAARISITVVATSH